MKDIYTEIKSNDEELILQLIYFCSLPGKEALYDPGKRAGQMKMVRENNCIMAYTWVEDGDQSHWEKVGEVLGSTDKDGSVKKQFDGQVTNLWCLFIASKI